MVSKASDDLPLPLRPVTTTSLSRGICSVRFLRLCSRAPPILMNSLLMLRISRYAERWKLRQAAPKAKPELLPIPAIGGQSLLGWSRWSFGRPQPGRLIYFGTAWFVLGVRGGAILLLLVLVLVLGFFRTFRGRGRA